MRKPLDSVMLLTCILILPPTLIWLNKRRLQRSPGLRHSCLSRANRSNAELRAGFDGLFFIDTTTRARPNH